MPKTPLVSIIIDNYNYARFLPFAIESALAQTYPHVEVIVVDDGSTDESLRVAKAYQDRITVIAKANGGQASALNAGFAASHGEVVFFLDADDVLAPDVVERGVARFQQDATIGKVLFRLTIITADGIPTEATTPPRPKSLPQGNLIPSLLQFPDDIPWSPTSGNAFGRAVLDAILPIPEADYPICADYYLSAMSTLFGNVAILAESGGFYRMHGQNYDYAPTISPDRRRRMILLTAATHRYLREKAIAQGYTVPESFVSFSYLAHRLLSLKTDPMRHPLPNDSIALVFKQSWQALTRPTIPVRKKFQYGGWFFVTALAPVPLLPTLAQLYFKAS